MKTIYKYPLNGGVSNTRGAVVSAVTMPQGAEFLRVDIQNGVVCLWAFVDTEAPKDELLFSLWGTGQDMRGVDPKHHIDTFLAGEYVFHLFEGAPKS